MPIKETAVVMAQVRSVYVLATAARHIAIALFHVDVIDCFCCRSTSVKHCHPDNLDYLDRAVRGEVEQK